MAVAKLAQARIKTLADMKRLTEDELKALPLGIVEYNAIKEYAASHSFRTRHQSPPPKPPLPDTPTRLTHAARPRNCLPPSVSRYRSGDVRSRPLSFVAIGDDLWTIYVVVGRG